MSRQFNPPEKKISFDGNLLRTEQKVHTKQILLFRTGKYNEYFENTVTAVFTVWTAECWKVCYNT